MDPVDLDPVDLDPVDLDPDPDPQHWFAEKQSKFEVKVIQFRDTVALR